MRVLVVRLGALGDIVHAVPAVGALARVPGSRIDWLVDARHEAVLDLFDLPVRALPIRPGRPDAALRMVRALRGSAYEVALDFQGLIKSAVLARLSGAARVVGFSRDALREPAAGLLYTERVRPEPNAHVIGKNMALVRHLGVPDTPLVEAPLRPATASGKPAGVDGRYALINPGGGWPNKRWPPERFGAVAAALGARRGWPSLVLWGPGERPLAEAVVATSGGAARLAPETTLARLVALLQGASLIVSGDTGPLHLAAAAGTPIVGVYGPTNPSRNGPWSLADVCVSRFEHCGCHHKRRCTRAAWCLDGISVAEVMAAIDRRLPDAQP